MRICCLHTALSNAEIFDLAASRLGIPGLALEHRVRADLLEAAEAAGGLTPTIQRDTADALVELSRSFDAVLLTCSTLGPAAAVADAMALAPVLRVDTALAREATAAAGKVVVLCAVRTTVDATLQTFNEAAARTGADVRIHLVDDAWDHFKAGDIDAYLAIIADAARAQQQSSKCVVALAQASMAGAAEYFPVEQRPLTSPTSGLLAAVAAARNRAKQGSA